MSKSQSFIDAIVNTSLGKISEEQAHLLQAALDSYGDELRKSITTVEGLLDKKTIEQLQGSVAEAHHVASFNIEAKAQGNGDLFASMSESKTDELSDVIIISKDGRRDDFQMKFYKDAGKTAKAFNHSKYTQKVGKITSKEQLTEVKQEAQRLAEKNRASRPEVAKNYRDTAENSSSTISDPKNSKIKSRPLKRKGKNGSEDLTKKIKKGKKIEYAHKNEAYKTQQKHQYANAVKYGALGGLITASAKELIDVINRKEPLSKEDYQAIAKNIVKGTAKGTGKALMTTAVQHAGKEMVKHSSKGALKGIGQQLSKGNVAANVAIIATQLGNDLFRLSRGDIDSIELAESTLNNGISLGASVAGYSLGVNASAYIGTFISSAVAETAVMGTTLGALGPIGLGIAGGIAASIMVHSYTTYFVGTGREIAIKDIESSFQMLSSGEISLGAYCGQVGTMTEFRFNWSDMLPLSGTFSVFGEYKARKQQLISLQQEIANKRANLPKKEAQMLSAMEQQFRQQLSAVETKFKEQKEEISRQTIEQLAQMEGELDQYLQKQFALQKQSLAHFATQRSELNRHQEAVNQRMQRLEHHKQELNSLSLMLEHSTDLSDRVRLKHVLNGRLSNLLPKSTPFDEAETFILGDSDAG